MKSMKKIAVLTN